MNVRWITQSVNVTMDVMTENAQKGTEENGNEYTYYRENKCEFSHNEPRITKAEQIYNLKIELSSAKEENFKINEENKHLIMENDTIKEEKIKYETEFQKMKEDPETYKKTK